MTFKIKANKMTAFKRKFRIFRKEFQFKISKIKNIDEEIKWKLNAFNRFIWTFLLSIPWILFFLSIAYMIFYIRYESQLDSWVRDNLTIAGLLFNIAYSIVTAGFIGAALKYYQILGFLEKAFSKIILSKKFRNVLKEEVEDIKFSEENLIHQPQLNELWIKVTKVKYEKRFPELKHKIEELLKSNFYLGKDLEYYYKNYNIIYDFELIDDKIVKLKQSISFTIVSNTLDKINWSYKSNAKPIKNFIIDGAQKKEDELVSYKFSIKNSNLKYDIKCSGPEIDYNEKGEKELLFEAKTAIKGYYDYVFVGEIEMYQDIDEDRFYDFASIRIIDDLNITIRPSEKLDIILQSTVGNKLYPDIDDKHGQVFSNKGILFNGELFKLVLIRKKNNNN